MNALPAPLRRLLENAAQDARDVAEAGALAALNALAVPDARAFPHLNEADKRLRVALRAQAKQLGDFIPKDAPAPALTHLVEKVAYDTWHRLLFTRFLAENQLLKHPGGASVTLNDCDELIREDLTQTQREFAAPDGRSLAVEFAARMLPAIFRADDPAGKVVLPPENRNALFKLIDDLPRKVFVASDSLGWCYQFWQVRRKETVNRSGCKIGADELPPFTQLFTEDYMVDFLLDNTLGAWHAGKVLADHPKLGDNAKSEEELRNAAALPGCPWKYLRFIRGADGKWTPAAGTFDGWPKTAKELKCLDPCMGSGHFVVAIFERMAALRMAQEKLDEAAAVVAVIRDNLFGLEIDPRCTQIGAFNLALAAWRRMGHRPLPPMNLACSGLAPNAREADWLAIAGGNQKLQSGMERLYRLFQRAPVLGSLINPRADEGDLLVAEFHELQPLLEKALAQEAADDTTHEMAVTAKGIAVAAEIMCGKFTLVVTNVPYVGFKKQTPVLQEFCEAIAPHAKANLATVFLSRCVNFCGEEGTVALVGPQNWLFLWSYREFREDVLHQLQWQLVARLGSGAFRTPMWDMNILLSIFSRSRPAAKNCFAALDVSAQNEPDEKAKSLEYSGADSVNQAAQLKNADSRIIFGEITGGDLLEESAISMRGIVAGDLDLWIRFFWEIYVLESRWKALQSTVSDTLFYGGREQVIDWSTNGIGMLRPGTRNKAYGKRGIVVSRMGNIKVSLYSGELYDQNCATVVPLDDSNLLPLWTFCCSDEYENELRKIDQKLNITNATLIKVPFDLAHWQNVAAEKYPNGLPKPFSSDPAQWLFNGHPKGADNPLQVAVARLLGYRWPRQTGSSFPDCPALGPDGLEKSAAHDGIVCIPSAGQEQPAENRLRALLAAAFGAEWSSVKESELLSQAGFAGKSMDDWLRNGFAEQHGKLFHHRPFIWQLWDGRKDGFSALVNYHRLDRALLDKLIYTYLGDWITRQEDGVQSGEGGSDARLTAARDLQRRLKFIAEGEPPYDIFVRWKTLAQQPLGWEPDLNDGVRLNIRPFVEAGVLRKDPNVNWKKDRGTDPASAPWFKVFDGERINDHHLTLAEKRAARQTKG